MGFYQDWRNELRWIGHEGDLIAFHSLFFVEPTQKLVLFVSFNSEGGGGRPRNEIINMFSDRYFPGAPEVDFLKTLPPEMKEIAGSWQPSRRADTTKLALENLSNQQSASVDKDGVLRIDDVHDLRGHTIRWKAIGKDLWQADNDQQRIFAIRDGANHVVRLAIDFPGMQLQRVPWYENSNFVFCLGGVSLLVLILTIAAELLRLSRRIFFRQRPRLVPQPGTLWITFIPRLAVSVWISIVGCVAGYIIASANSISTPTPAWYTWFVVINWITALAILLSIFAALKAVSVAMKDGLRWITKVKFALVGLSCLAMSWIAVHWNVIGPAHRI